MLRKAEATLRRVCLAPQGISARASDQRSANASDTGGTTFSIISTEGSSHTGAEGQEPHYGATKTVTGRQTGPSPVDRGRAGSKHHLITDRHGTPLAVLLTGGGNRNDVVGKPSYQNLCNAVTRSGVSAGRCAGVR